MANTTGVKPAGYINVSKIELRAFDDSSRFVNLVQMYTHIQINESMHSPYVHGHIHIIDAYGMIYQSVLGKQFAGNINNLPHIHGEELMTIEYEDDASTEKHEETYFVYAVDEIELADKTKETALSYKLYFCSIPKMFSDTFIIRKAYRNMTIAEMVRDIFDEYYTLENPIGNGTKPIEIEPTTGRQTLVIPALTPEQAIMFLARRAYSAESKSSLFFFWETRDKFYFYTHEGLRRLYEVKDARTAESAGAGAAESEARYNYFEYYNGPNDNTPTGQERARTIVSGAKLSSTNSAAHIKNEAYTSRVTELDILNRAVRKYKWDYKEEYRRFDNIDDIRLNNTTPFINTVTHADRPNLEYTESHIIKDYRDPGNTSLPAEVNQLNYDREYPYYVEKLTMTPIFAHHLNSNKMKGNITGRQALFAGDFIYFAIPEFSVDSMRNAQVLDNDNIGEQMITGIVHFIEGNKWASQIEFTKGGKGGGPESLPQELSTPQLTASIVDEPIAGDAATQPAGPGVTTERPQPGDIQLPASLANDREFNAEVDRLIAKYPGMSRQDLYRVMQGESRFDPTIQNSIGATGLFQFVPSTAQGLGVTTDQIRNMSPAQQVRLYDRYLGQFNYQGGPLGIMQAAPAYANRPANFVVYPRGSRAWEQNPGWRTTGGGDITVASINRYYDEQGA